ncbi:MAG TPA: dockerin type I repeat-containing protein [Planctomycetota bacterium]|jgi:hypothetical protein|nr:dockerin type I repeat-containing protein [Planctomycetota bacterium]OQC22127.1 MAG: hypothetical protein BWX69_00438 [Planctomycetes bacterium ADurb.Bin069]HNS00388.1 dockerin type I repeat-containing protein [Planctomycetota bacterium]HNU25738.1 dockerin type I repeat-containing protein [Planctomycetota bacterium]HOE28708.1 dockerin type I repeat-containing protein [Planctomycetota bacterium]
MALRILAIVSLALLCFFWVWTGSAHAGIEPVPWSVPLASGFDNPVFWVLFNPQPEPPGNLTISMDVDPSVPTAPVFKVRNIFKGVFFVELAIQGSSEPVSAFRYVRAKGDFQVLALSLTGLLYTASFSFKCGGSSLGPGADVMFNPQTEPPGFPGAIMSFSLLDAVTGVPPLQDSVVEMTLGVSRPGGELLSLALAVLPFVRGDTNADGKFDIADPIYVLSYLFARGPAPSCKDAADANDDGKLDIGDAVKILDHLFGQTGPLPPPFDQCNIDPTFDQLDCESFFPCQ